MVRSLCRFCHAVCPIDVEIENGRSTRVSGTRGNPVYHGFTCAKGRELPRFHSSPERLLHSQRRRPDGTHEDVASAAAMDEIAARLSTLIEEHGPRSVAVYVGTHGYNNFLTGQTAFAFMDAIGSPMVFTSVTIDQPGKAISSALHGTWLAGPPSIEQADAWLAIGTNPMISMLGPVNPGRAFTEAQRRGMKLVVVDPRRTEIARRAHVHLQPRPGQDPTILAGLLRVIFREGWEDPDFVAAETTGLDRLRAAIEPFTPEVVARRADVSPEKLREAARAMTLGRTGVATVGTGPNMSGRGNLTEYLAKVLMTVCGHWLREGDTVPNPGVFIQWPPRIAQAVPAQPAWGFGERLRVRGFTNTAAGLPTAAAADEMILEGPGRVRALLNLGGNPLLAWPDQRKTDRALKGLDLLVSIDPVMSATARVSDFVIAPKLTFETPGTSALAEMLGVFVGWGLPRPFGQYTPALIEPPPGSDVIDDWELLHGVAARMGKALRVGPSSILDPEAQAAAATLLDPENPPTSDELLEILLAGSPVPLEEVKKHPDGHVFDRPTTVQAKASGHDGRLEIGDRTMMAELDEIAATQPEAHEGFPFRLISRRLPDVHNSSWHGNEKLGARFPGNPAFMHPDDAAALGIDDGALIEITSAHDTIRGVLRTAADLRRGVVSMSHCFGRAPDEEEDPLRDGANTSRLSDSETNYDPYTGIPRMSTIPVAIRPAAEEAG